MSGLDDLYRDLITPPQDQGAVPGRKNITLRLSKDTHEKLEHIRVLGAQSKTVMAEEILVSAIDDIHSRMMNDPRLQDWWEDRAETLRVQEQDAIERAMEDSYSELEAARNG